MEKIKRNLSIMWECYNKELGKFILHTASLLVFTILMSFLISPWYLVINIIYPTLFFIVYKNMSSSIDESLINAEKINKYNVLANKFNKTE